MLGSGEALDGMSNNFTGSPQTNGKYESGDLGSSDCNDFTYNYCDIDGNPIDFGPLSPETVEFNKTVFSILVIDFECTAGETCNGLEQAFEIITALPTPVKILRVAKLRKLRNLRCSFIAGTLVSTPDGLVAIEGLKEGDLVYARPDDPDDGEEVVPRKINAVFVEDHSEVIELKIDTGSDVELIYTTAEHPFYVAGSGWTDASEIALEDRLETLDGDELRVLGITVIQEAQPAYNFEVDEHHTYAVGEAEVWVHNMCGDEAIGNLEDLRSATGKIRGDIDPNLVDKIQGSKENLEKAQRIVKKSVAQRKDEFANNPGHLTRIRNEQKVLDQIETALKEFD